jgi:hypothetical protein
VRTASVAVCWIRGGSFGAFGHLQQPASAVPTPKSMTAATTAVPQANFQDETNEPRSSRSSF